MLRTIIVSALYIFWLICLPGEVRADDKVNVDSLSGNEQFSGVLTATPDDTDAVSLVSNRLNIVDTVVVIPRLDFSSISLFDALTALARAYDLSLYIDSSVAGNISLRLDNVLLNDALLFIIEEYDLQWRKTGNIIKIFKPVVPLPEPEPLDISFADGLISFDLKKAELGDFVTALIDLTGRNIIVENNARGYVSGKITELDLEKAMRVVLPANGFTFKKIDDVIYVSAADAGTKPGARTANLHVKYEDNRLSLDVANTRLSDVISAVTVESGANIFVQTQLEGNITASFSDKTVEEALTYLLLNSEYTFNETNGIYFVGNRSSEDLHDTKLIRLKHLIATNLESLIPVSLSKQITIKVVKEHNGLALTGPRTAIARLESFIEELDIPTAQVLFEVLVVDYTTTERAEFGITANNMGPDSDLPGQIYYPQIDLSTDGQGANAKLRSAERHLGISKLGILGEDFFIRLEMMKQEGKANLISHPKIATLNGHPASISIGTSQYYLLESQTVYPSQQSNVSTQTSQRFEIVQADMSLEVVPYVNTNRELIVEVKPEFNTPAESFNPDIPPTINRRVLNSTVRLKDGETIVLGGLVQNTVTKTIDKLPILGDIPLIGRLFQNRRSTDVQSELMIYITPHVYFGSEGAVNIDTLLIKK